jgi:hypothetical protein
MHGKNPVNKIYDPAAGSGSLLLQAKKHFDAHIIEDGFFGQEINIYGFFALRHHGTEYLGGTEWPHGLCLKGSLKHAAQKQNRLYCGTIR